MRGFVITILSISLIVTLIVLTTSFRNAQLSNERALIEPLPLIYAAVLLDDIAYEFNSIVGPQVDIDERNDSIKVTMIDTLHNYNHSAEIFRYDVFLRGEVASRTASNITTNFTNLNDGVMRLFINEEYTYTNDHIINESIFTKTGDTGATLYEINFTVTAVRANVEHIEFNDSGTMNVTIQYTDLNGTVIETGTVFPDNANTMKIDYIGGSSITVTIGSVNGNSSSLRMKSSGITADTSWAVTLPRINETKKMGYEYDATINYTQGRVSKHGRIGK